MHRTLRRAHNCLFRVLIEVFLVQNIKRAASYLHFRCSIHKFNHLEIKSTQKQLRNIASVCMFKSKTQHRNLNLLTLRHDFLQLFVMFRYMLPLNAIKLCLHLVRPGKVQISTSQNVGIHGLR